MNFHPIYLFFPAWKGAGLRARPPGKKEVKRNEQIY